MSLAEFISPRIPIVQVSGTVEDALRLMEDHDVDQLPLADGTRYISLLKEEPLLSVDAMMPLSTWVHTSYRPFIIENEHPYQALSMMQAEKLCVLPVLHENEELLGSLNAERLATYFTRNGSLDKTGAIIILEVELKNYSLWELARITESEGIRILTSQAHRQEELGLVEVTMKLDTLDVSPLVQAFERHQIEVKRVFGDQEFSDDLDGRYKELMHYLNM